MPLGPLICLQTETPHGTDTQLQPSEATFLMKVALFFLTKVRSSESGVTVQSVEFVTNPGRTARAKVVLRAFGDDSVFEAFLPDTDILDSRDKVAVEVAEALFAATRIAVEAKYKHSLVVTKRLESAVGLFGHP